MKTNTPPVLITFAIVCFALFQNARAVLPPPDGGYGPPDYGPGNTAEGQEALLSLTTGTYNAANGYLSLRSNTIGNFNTAIGAGALLFNTANQNTATGSGALLNNTTGGHNTANGAFALFTNTAGSTTLPSVMVRCLRIPPTAIQLSAVAPFLAIPVAAATLQMVR